MQRLLRILILTLFVSSTLLPPLYAAAGLQTATPPADRPLSLTVSLRSEQPALKESTRAEGTFTTFDSPLPLLGQPGAPALPVVRQLVAIPTGSAPRLEVGLASAQALPAAPRPLEPVPTYDPVQHEGSDNLADELVARYSPDAALYAQDGWYPANPISISDVMMLRGQAMVAVEFTSVQVNLASGELRWLPAADVTLSWAQESLPRNSATPQDDPYYEGVFAKLLSNYDQARAWRMPAEPTLQAQRPSVTTDRWMIAVEGEGLFKVPLADLAAQGVNTSNPSRLALYYGSGDTVEEQAIWIDGTTLYFVNVREHSRWSRQVVYHLEVLPSGSGKRMSTLSGATVGGPTLSSVPYILPIEQNLSYMTLKTRVNEDERWFWKKLLANNDPTYPGNDRFLDVTFDLPHLNTAATENVTILPKLGPVEGPEYVGRCNDVTVTIEGHSVSRAWSDFSEFGQTLSIPPSDLAATGNDAHVEFIRCDSSAILNAIMVDRFDVTYQRTLETDSTQLSFENAKSVANYRLTEVSSDSTIFEVNDPSNVKRLTGTTLSGSTLTFGRPSSNLEAYLVAGQSQGYAVSSITYYVDQGLRTDLSQTDYVIIAPDEFLSAVQPLIALRESQGYSTRLVPANAIYNDFGVGSKDPAAIRNFTEFAYANWAAPKPAYILLVGDGNYDPLNYLGIGEPMLLPPMLVYEDDYLGEVPSDNAFVSGLDGSSDELPDINIGRLPAQTLADATAMVDKLIQYESGPAIGDWQRRVLFTADNPDSAGDFHQYSEQLRPYLPDNTLVTTAYLPTGATSAQILDVRDSIKNSINHGQLIVQYIGHAGRTQWAGEQTWALRRSIGGGLFASDLDLLTEGVGRYPLALSWACWDGYYIKPGEQSLSESMIRLDDRGVIAAFAPVGLDVATAHDLMARAFFAALFPTTSAEPMTQLGELTLIAKTAVSGTNSVYNRLIYTYMLFGDPATHLSVDPCLYDDSLTCSGGGQLFMPLVSQP